MENTAIELLQRIVKEFQAIDLSQITKWSTLSNTPLHAEISVKLFPFFIENAWLPFVSVFLYLTLSGPVFFRLGKFVPKFFVKWITIVHNIILTIYSGWTFYNSLLLCITFYKKLQSGEVYQGFLQKSDASLLYGVLCDPDDILWTKDHLGFWVTHFYISKYYEFIDTWIWQLKGITPIFLQTYHHAGIVILMYGFVVTRNSPGGTIVLVLNSFIHTLMYFYYTLSAMGIKSSLKQMLTTAQLVQFIVGVGMTVPAYWIKGCTTLTQKVTLFFIHIYTIYLIKLFADFYKQEYLSEKKKKP